MPEKTHILFVDDQWARHERRDAIRAPFGALEKRDPPYEFHYETAETSAGRYGVEPVLEHIRRIPTLAAVVLDVMFGDDGSRLGLEILSAIRGQYPTLPVFMMTQVERDEIDVVEKAMELGANEYLIKTPTREELETVLRIYTQPSAMEGDYAIWGNSTAIRTVRALIARVAVSGTASVLITGESGTGKELVARAIHRQGPKRGGPFIEKNCAFAKSDLLDSDLFGHEKGAFTGALQQHQGRLERASGGTLFLDEIGSMSEELQGKLLRVLETHRFQRLGGVQDITSDFQLVCATNESPQEMVRAGKLRQDLYFRIRQIGIELPPLRERRSDISILADSFLRRFRATGGASYPAMRISADAVKCLGAYHWPGNVRELRNVVERAVILGRSKVVATQDLPEEVIKNHRSEYEALTTRASSLPDDPEKWAGHRIKVELRLLEDALEQSGWNGTRATTFLFSEVNSPNATYIKRYIKRLQEPPWGGNLDTEAKGMVKRILARLGRSNASD